LVHDAEGSPWQLESIRTIGAAVRFSTMAAADPTKADAGYLRP
jgi:hypothetical protein